MMLKKMNEALGEPAVITVRGGKDQGTFLTDLGRKLLAEYETNKQIINETIGDETCLGKRRLQVISQKPATR